MQEKPKNTLFVPLASLVAFIVLSVLIFHPLVAKISTHILADDVFIRPGQSDAFNFFWTYWWIQKALSLWNNIYYCTWVFPPNGL